MKKYRARSVHGITFCLSVNPPPLPGSGILSHCLGILSGPGDGGWGEFSLEPQKVVDTGAKNVPPPSTGQTDLQIN